MDILFSKQAKKYIEACDKPTKQRLKTAIMAIPNGDIKKLKGYDNWYRLRIGSLRILFEYTDEAMIITDILPRGQVYKGI